MFAKLRTIFAFEHWTLCILYLYHNTYKWLAKANICFRLCKHFATAHFQWTLVFPTDLQMNEIYYDFINWKTLLRPQSRLKIVHVFQCLPKLCCKMKLEKLNAFLIKIWNKLQHGKLAAAKAFVALLMKMYTINVATNFSFIDPNSGRIFNSTDFNINAR